MSGSCSDLFRTCYNPWRYFQECFCLARQHSNAISPWWREHSSLWEGTPVLHRGYIVRCGVGRNQECKESLTEGSAREKACCRALCSPALFLPCPCAARFIKFRLKNLNSRSLLASLFPSSLGIGFCGSRLILHNWVTRLWQGCVTALRLAVPVLGVAQVWDAFCAGSVQRKVQLCHCHLCLSQKSVCSCAFDLISFLSGMCTLVAIYKVNSAVLIINYPWGTLEGCWPPDQSLLESLWLVWMSWKFDLLIWPTICCQDVPGSKR